MPNRVIKESIKWNDQIDSLTWFEEVVYYRLMVTADDYGVVDGRAALLKSELFPLKESVTRKAIENAIEKLTSVGLLRSYAVSGKPYLLFPTWEKHQRIRNKRSKYPMPVENGLTVNCQSNDSQMTDVRRPESESNPNPNPESKEDEEDARAREGWERFAVDYERNIGSLPVTEIEREDLTMFFDEFGPDALHEFIAATARKHPDNPHVYFTTICRKNLGKGIRTADAAKAALMDYDRQKGGRRDAGSGGNADGSPRRIFDGQTIV